MSLLPVVYRLQIYDNRQSAIKQFGPFKFRFHYLS